MVQGFQYLIGIGRQAFRPVCSGLKFAVSSVRQAAILRQALSLCIPVGLTEAFISQREICTSNWANTRRRLWKFYKFVIPSKRMGTRLFLTYIIMKCLYLINSVGQIFMMQSYLGFDSGNYTLFGGSIAHNILQGRDWQVTLVFPRVGYCIVPIRHLGALNYVTAQCVLPVNMLNERIYVFLWFWLSLASVINACSLPVWYVKMIYRKPETYFIKKYLRLNEAVKRNDSQMLDRFQSRFLRHDGLFILHMIAINAGELICSDVVHQLWKIFKRRFYNCDFNKPSREPKDPDQIDELKAMCGKRDDEEFGKKPTAPVLTEASDEDCCSKVPYSP